jgi:tetratricopeptide (TPR) repeat protein
MRNEDIRLTEIDLGCADCCQTSTAFDQLAQSSSLSCLQRRCQLNYSMAAIHLQCGNSAQALSAIQNALRMCPTNMSALVFQSILLFREHRYKLGLVSLQQVLNRSLSNVQMATSTTERCCAYVDLANDANEEEDGDVDVIEEEEEEDETSSNNGSSAGPDKRLSGWQVIARAYEMLNRSFPEHELVLVSHFKLAVEQRMTELALTRLNQLLRRVTSLSEASLHTLLSGAWSTAAMQLHLDQLPASQIWLQRCLELVNSIAEKDVHNEQDRARVLIDLATVCLACGQGDDALRHAEQARIVAQDLPASLAHQSAVLIARACVQTGQIDRAHVELDEVQQAAEQQQQLSAGTLSSLALLASELHQRDDGTRELTALCLRALLQQQQLAATSDTSDVIAEEAGATAKQPFFMPSGVPDALSLLTALIQLGLDAYEAARVVAGKNSGNEAGAQASAAALVCQEQLADYFDVLVSGLASIEDENGNQQDNPRTPYM